MTHKKHISWQEFENLSQALAQKIQDGGEKFEGIIAVARGGLPLATYLSHQLHLPTDHTVTAESYDDETRKKGFLTFRDLQPSDKRFLIVDDLTDSGETLDTLLDSYPNAATATLFHKAGTSEITPDYYAEEASEWIVFPWEIDK